MPTPCVRPVEVDDAARIRGLANHCQPLLVNGVYVNLFLAKYFGNTCFILEGEVGPIGFVTGLRSTVEPEIFFLWQLGLTPAERGKRHSALLIEAIAGAAIGLGCRRMQLSISPGNAESLGTFMSFARKTGRVLRAVEEQKYEDPLSGKNGHEIFYELVL